MNEEQNKAVVRRFVEELWNQRKLAVADELVAPDCITHQLRSGENAEGSPRSPASVRAKVAAWTVGFPDLSITIEQLVAEGARVATHCTLRGTHTGNWMGHAPTARKVTVPMYVVHRIAAGKIAEDWVLIGSLAMIQQLGLLPPTSEILPTRG